jgi:hypothetical protein
MEVPGTAALNAGGSAYVNAISCGSAGNCSAGGFYKDLASHNQAFVADETNGTWGSAIEVPGSAALNSGGGAGVSSFSCSSAGNCSAGGYYTDPANHNQAFVVNETNGTWGNAIEVPGTAALNTGGYAYVNAISCGSAGNCSAGGNYRDPAGHTQAFVVDETNGTWGSAIEVPGSATLNTGGGAQVSSVSCSSAGNCSAGGYYTDPASHNQAFVVDETNGTWGSAIEVPGTAALNTGGDAYVNAISCGSAGNCSAGGGYTLSSTHYQAFVVNETNGTWGSAIEVPGTAALNTGGAAGVSSVSCSSAGNCSAGGYYKDPASHNQAFVVDETNGTWGSAIEVPGTALLDAGGDAHVNAISCGSAGNCSAGGGYALTSNHYQAFVVDETNGTWGSAIEVPGSASLNAGGSAEVYSISCASVGNCSAGGSYTDSSNHHQAMVDGLTATTSTTTTTTTVPPTTTTTTVPPTTTTTLKALAPRAPSIHASSTSKGVLSISLKGTVANGGSPITRYQYSLGGKSWINISKNSHGVFVISHLISNKTYSVRLRAVNRVGAGVSSNTVKVKVK